MRLTKRGLKIIWVMSLSAGLATSVLSLLFTFPDRPVLAVDWSNPVVLPSFANATVWSVGAVEGVDKGQYGIRNGYAWLAHNKTTVESVGFKMEVGIDVGRFPYLGAEFSGTYDSVMRLAVKPSERPLRQVLSAPNQTRLTTVTLSLREVTNKTVTEIWVFINDLPANAPPGEARVYLHRLLLYRQMAQLNWYDFVVVALFSTLTGPAIAYQIESSRKDSIDKNLPEFLRNIAEAGRTGMTLYRAIEVSVERSYGQLTEQLRRLVAQLRWRKPMDVALREFAEKADTALARRTALLVTEASRSGGDIQESIETVSNHVREIQELEDKRKGEMRPYIAVIYISFAVFLLTVYLLLTQFFASIAKIGPVGFLGAQEISIEAYGQVFLYMSVVEAIFGGLVGGKMSSGSIRNGIKHAVILVAISFIVFNFFV